MISYDLPLWFTVEKFRSTPRCETSLNNIHYLSAGDRRIAWFSGEAEGESVVANRVSRRAGATEN